MANNNKQTDQLKKDHGNNITQGAKKGLKLSIGGTIKGASFVARVGIKTAIKIIRKVITYFFSALAASFVVVILVCALLSGLIIETAMQMNTETNTKQEAPELTKAYLNTNKDKFKDKIHALVKTKQFNDYIVKGEFDNSYTKLIYGGTPAYSHKELKGYAKANEEDASFIKFSKDAQNDNKTFTSLEKLINDVSTKSVKEMKKILSKKNAASLYPMTYADASDTKDNSLGEEVISETLDCLKEKENPRNEALNYLEQMRSSAIYDINMLIDDENYATCTSLLEKLDWYKNKYNLKDNQIQINDDYLRGYNKASGYKEATSNEAEASATLPFNKWINQSYYVIPYYYHVNTARNSTYVNQMGGTLYKAASFYSKLCALFTAEAVKSAGALVFAAGAGAYANAEAKSSTMKKMCNDIYDGCKDDKKRKEFSDKLINFFTQKEKIAGKATMAVGGGIYAGGTFLSINSISSILKGLVDDPSLQVGCPNWNNDSGGWQFMRFENKDVTKRSEYDKKNPTKFQSKEASWAEKGMTLSPNLTTLLGEKPKVNRTIWNNQSRVTCWLAKGTNIFAQWTNALQGIDSVWDSLEDYKENYEPYNKQEFKNMSYKDILNTGFTKYYLRGFNIGEPNNKSFYGYPAQGVCLGYSQEPVESSLESNWNEFWGYDGLYNYNAFSKHAKEKLYEIVIQGTGEEATTDFSEIKDDLYIYKWEDKKTKNSKYSNYYNYLWEPKDIETISKRELKISDNEYSSINNTLIDTLTEQFAQYFINQIYYIYSDNIYDSKEIDTETGGGRDYIHDWFLSDTVSDNKKIAFLQRSFYSMASGSSYTYEAKEEYDIKNGKVLNKLNGATVGEIDLISNISISSINKIHTPISKITKTTKQGTWQNSRGGVPVKGADGKTYNGTGTFTRYSYEVEDSDESFGGINDPVISDDNGFDIKNCTTTTIIDRLAAYNSYLNGDKGYYEAANSSGEHFSVYYNGTISYKNNKNKKGTTKATIQVRYDKSTQKDTFKTHYIIIPKGGDDAKEKFFYSNVKWDKEFYETHKDDIKAKNYEIEIKDPEYDGINVTVGKIINNMVSPTQVTKIINGITENKYPMDGNIVGEREICIDYNTAGFLSYSIDEEKDDNGNITGITAGIYMKLPEVNMETRLAYMWEKEGMLDNAFKLLDIYDKQKNLKDSEGKVDLDQLIINYKASEDLDASLDKDVNYDSTLPNFINNEMIEAAFETQVKYGVPCSSTFAQIIAESGFGKYDGLSGLARKNHNLFGMKSGNNKWTAGSCSYSTKEQSANGTTYGTVANFSNYKTFKDSIYDRADLLTSFKRVGYGPHTKPFLNTRYMKGKTTNKEYPKSKAVKFIASYSYPNNPRWATSQNYLQSCVNHMNKYNLYQYDNMTLEEFKSGFSNGGPTGSGIEKIIDVAYQKCNKKPYSQNTALRKGPKYFDCSGLVWFCFKHGAGIEIGNSTHDQPQHIQGLIRQRAKYKKSGKGWWVEQIPASTPVRDLKRGDVVYNARHHVVLYLGGNKEFAARDYGILSGPGKFSMTVRTHIFRFHFPDSSGSIGKQGVTLTNKEFKEKKKQSNFKLLSKKTNCTGYCSCATCCGKSNGVTASGKKLVPNYTCAVDTSIIPLGSTVYVYFKKDKKWHVYEAMDVGGAIKGSHIDLAFASHSKALTWGSKTCKVYYYTPPKGHN